MASLAPLVQFPRKADVCRAGRVDVSRRPFLEMPGNLTGSRQFLKSKFKEERISLATLVFHFVSLANRFIIEFLKLLKPSWRKAEQLYGLVMYQNPDKRAPGLEKAARP